MTSFCHVRSLGVQTSAFFGKYVQNICYCCFILFLYLSFQMRSNRGHWGWTGHCLGGYIFLKSGPPSTINASQQQKFTMLCVLFEFSLHICCAILNNNIQCVPLIELCHKQYPELVLEFSVPLLTLLLHCLEVFYFK